MVPYKSVLLYTGMVNKGDFGIECISHLVTFEKKWSLRRTIIICMDRN